MAYQGEAMMNEDVVKEPVDEKKLLASTDASVWAKEFKKVHPEVDEGLMLKWFASAMMVGYDEGKKIYENINTCYIELGAGYLERTVEINDALILVDMDADENPLGVELIGVPGLHGRFQLSGW
jgi:hypothetical protein